MTDEFIEQLRKVELFQGLPDETLRAIAARAETRKLAAGEVLMKKGEPGDSLFLIHEGTVKITTVNAKGEELILNRWGAGAVIGEMSLIDGGTRSASVTALEDVEALELRRDAFERILENPSVSLAIIRGLTKRLRFATTYIERAIDLAQKIAAGDYSFLEESQPLLKDANDDSKAAQMLSTFFTMVRKVKEREETLKKQVEKLTFEIDQARRKQEFEEITGTEFYAKLKEQAKALRQKRAQE